MEKEEEMAAGVMVSAISFIQAILQHSTADSKVRTRTVGGVEIDMALKQEAWYREGRIMGLNIAGYTVYCSLRVG